MLTGIPRIGPRVHQFLEQFLQDTDSWCYIWCSIFLRKMETLENWKRCRIYFSISVNSLEIIMCPKNVSIYESLIGYEGRGPKIQYMPNKHHHHFGLKFFCLCESESGCTYNFSIYEGKQNSSSEYGISQDICIELMAPLLGQGIIFLQITGILQLL